MAKEADSKEAPKTTDAATEKKKKKQRTKLYRYPSNIGSDEQPHAINFFIFKTESAAEVKSRQEASEKLANEGDESAGEKVKLENDRQSFLGKVAAVGFGAFVGASIKAVKGSDGLAAAGAGGGALAASALFSKAGAMQTRTTQKIDSAISLYIPNSPQAKYGAEFNVADLGTLMGGGMADELGIGKTGGSMMSKLSAGDFAGAAAAAAESGAGSAIARQMANTADIPKAIGLGDVNVGGAIRASTRTITNPYKEQIFQTMGFRSFAFQYKFAPRNEKELSDVMNIINLFKAHMHPEKDLGGLFFTFPSEFKIEYVYKNRENSYLNKIAPCFLTDLSIDYGNGGTFTTFKDARGAPSEITMSMAFRETELLTRSRIEEGY